LNLTIRENPILNQVSLTVNNGSAHGLIGPNGAGKTTTIQCLTGVSLPDSGNISFYGVRYSAGKSLMHDQEMKFRVGVLFDNPVMLDYLTGDEYLKTISTIYQIDKMDAENRIQKLFHFFDLHANADMLIDNYSKGMKRKLELASLILYNPELYILDEPFESLDSMTISKLKKLILHLKSLGKSFLITSHILPYMEEICDQFTIIDNGKIVLQTDEKDMTGGLSASLEDTLLNALSMTTESYRFDSSILDWLV